MANDLFELLRTGQIIRVVATKSHKQPARISGYAAGQAQGEIFYVKVRAAARSALFTFLAVRFSSSVLVGSFFSSLFPILVLAHMSSSTLVKDWGYAALVEYDGKRILFDTGNDADTFQRNVEALGVDLKRLDAVVIAPARRPYEWP